MSVTTHYFVAASEAEAAAVIDKGPAGQPGIAHVAEWSGIDPVVMLGTLEELITGVTFEELLAAGQTKSIAQRDGGMLLVLPVRPGLLEALATSDDGGLAAYAVQWSQTDELEGSDPDDLAEVISELAALARSARETGGGVYCWISV